MGTQRAQFEPFAWSLTKERIGQELQERYLVPQELPLQLLTVVWKLDAIGAKRAGWLSTLDAIEGTRLFRACNKRLRSLHGMRSITYPKTEISF
jgi:hypothetical protein